MSVHQSMRRTIFGALAAVALTAAPALAADPVFPVNSRVGLVPPAGFVPSTKFVGFENPQASAAILLVAMPAEAYAGDREELHRRGAEVARHHGRDARADDLQGRQRIFVAGPKEQDGTKRYESVLIASLAGVTALVSVQMLESSRATVTDAVVRDALKTLAVRQQIPDAERLAVLPYKIGNLSGFRVVRTAHDGTAVLTLGPKDAVDERRAAVRADRRRDRRGAEAGRSRQDRPSGVQLRARHQGHQDHPLRAAAHRAGERATRSSPRPRTRPATSMSPRCSGCASGRTRICRCSRSRGARAWNEVYPKLRAIRDGIEPR